MQYDGSTSRKTKGSMADTLQCNLWRRAQPETPHRMTHSLHGGKDTGLNNGFTAIGKRIGTKKAKWERFRVHQRTLSYQIPSISSPPWTRAGLGGWCSCAVSGWRQTWRTIRVGLCWWTATAPWSIACTTTPRAGTNAFLCAKHWQNFVQTMCKSLSNKM